MNIIRTVLAQPTGVELVYTTNEGKYLGRVRLEGPNAGVNEMMAKDVVDFLAEQQAEAENPQIALAVATSLRGN